MAPFYISPLARVKQYYILIYGPRVIASVRAFGVGVQLAIMHCLAHRLCETNALLTKHGRRCYVETNVPADNPLRRVHRI